MIDDQMLATIPILARLVCQMPTVGAEGCRLDLVTHPALCIAFGIARVN
jgi:hypothetical protein